MLLGLESTDTRTETAVNYRIKYLFVLFGQDEDSWIQSWITATPVQLTVTAQRAL